MVNPRPIFRLYALIGAAFCASLAFFLLYRGGLPRSPDFVVMGADNQPIEAAVLGGRVPTFEGHTLDGDFLRVAAPLDTPLIITFWATWCAPCEADMPALEALYQNEIAVLGINVGPEDAALVRAWLAEREIHFPIMPDDASHTLEARFRIRGLPTTFFIDSRGIIQHIEAGALTPESLAEGLAAIR